MILLNSASEAMPRGLANSSDMVGRNIMDHMYQLLTIAVYPQGPDSFYFGRRPNGFYIPRYRNLNGRESEFLRGYGYQGSFSRNGCHQSFRVVTICNGMVARIGRAGYSGRARNSPSR